MLAYSAAKCLTSTDGGGYQGIASLLIIDALMKRIVKTSEDQSPTRPCEVFDVIGGVGTGGFV